MFNVYAYVQDEPLYPNHLSLVTHRIHKLEDDTADGRYTLHGTLWDLAILAIPRILSALVCITIAYHKEQDMTSYRPHPNSLYHENGDRKSSPELAEELLEGKLHIMFSLSLSVYVTIGVTLTSSTKNRFVRRLADMLLDIPSFVNSWCY